LRVCPLVPKVEAANLFPALRRLRLSLTQGSPADPVVERNRRIDQRHKDRCDDKTQQACWRRIPSSPSGSRSKRPRGTGTADRSDRQVSRHGGRRPPESGAASRSTRRSPSRQALRYALCFISHCARPRGYCDRSLTQTRNRHCHPRSYDIEPAQRRSDDLPKRIDRAEPIHLLVDSTGLKIYDEGEWLDQKHGIRSRRRWRHGNTRSARPDRC
jgi:hypothetical protein